MVVARKSLAPIGVLLAGGLILSACGGDDDNAGASASPSSSASVPQIDAAAFTSDFALMKQLTGLASQGKGKIGVLLPDTTTSTRYVQYDAPYLKQAFETAGLSADQFTIQNAQGSASTMQTQADAMISSGASVLLVDPLDPGSGAAIESKAEAAGAKVIDYDRLVTGGPADRYYVSFDNVKVGSLIGQGEVDCITAWNVSKPNILIMNGDPSDNNAKLFAQGYHSVLDPKFTDGSYVKVGEPAGTWTPSVAATTFQQQQTAHKNINAVVTPNDDNANAVISVLKSNKTPAKTFPTTGQDASLPGLQNILTGYQCGTVYKPIYLEAQAAAALALYLRAGVTPPTTLVNAKTTDTKIGKDIASVYTTPIWVTSENMNDTVVKDGAVTKDKLCAGAVASACTAAGIS
ncbi:MAG TPA: substrate-binding domain-containing protein [Actinomycetes bacterium]|nr:substrate-binding domain-containing protein [Actinomycetes bacterium]